MREKGELSTVNNRKIGFVMKTLFSLMPELIQLTKIELSMHNGTHYLCTFIHTLITCNSL